LPPSSDESTDYFLAMMKRAVTRNPQKPQMGPVDELDPVRRRRRLRPSWMTPPAEKFSRPPAAGKHAVLQSSAQEKLFRGGHRARSESSLPKIKRIWRIKNVQAWLPLLPAARRGGSAPPLAAGWLLLGPRETDAVPWRCRATGVWRVVWAVRPRVQPERRETWRRREVHLRQAMDWQQLCKAGHQTENKRCPARIWFRAQRDLVGWQRNSERCRYL
jgi:hypothetical protein